MTECTGWGEAIHMRQRSDRWFLQLCYAMVGLAVVALAISSGVGLRRSRTTQTPARIPAKAQMAGESGVPGEPGREQGGTGDLGQQTREAKETATVAALPDLPLSPAPMPEGMSKAVLEAGTDFFEEFRLERERERALEIEAIQGVAASPDTDPEVRREAQAALLAAVSRARREFDAESMILARGYADAIVSVTSEGASVVVKSGRLEEAGVRAIGDMVARATGVNLSRITIAERQE